MKFYEESGENSDVSGTVTPPIIRFTCCSDTNLFAVGPE